MRAKASGITRAGILYYTNPDTMTKQGTIITVDGNALSTNTLNHI
jgi:hypothetical protein